MIVIVAGLPGTGKTTVSKKLGKELDAPVLSTDKIRRHSSDKGKYTPKKKLGVYDRMFHMAEGLLSEKEDVILDGTFYRKNLRVKARRLAKSCDKRPFILEVRCDEEMVRQRIGKRYEEKEDASEADFKVYKIIKSQFEPIEEEHFVLDTGDESFWKEKLLDMANKMRVGEKQEKVVDRLSAQKEMKLIQTHISWVLLDGKNAYKIKKPVRFSFVDYSSLERRRHFCEKENSINSRLCPELYLGVATIRKDDGRITQEEGRGETVEFAVKMKELPQQERMDHLLEKNKVEKSHMRDVAAILADFHAQTSPAPGELGSPEVVRENFSPAFRAKTIMTKFFEAGGKVEFVRARVDEFLRKERKLFEKRVADGKIKNCHGDVRPKNIFIHEGRIFLFDAIEFNQKISGCDVAAEIAFLAMDLDFYGRSDLGQEFLSKYVSLTEDRDIYDLIDFYRCYRAMVEALVQSYLLADAEVSQERKEDAAEDCREYLNLACAYAEKIRWFYQ